VAVGGDGDETVDGVSDTYILVTEELRHELECVGELGVEVVLGVTGARWARATPPRGRDVIGTDERWAMAYEPTSMSPAVLTPYMFVSTSRTSRVLSLRRVPANSGTGPR